MQRTALESRIHYTAQIRERERIIQIEFEMYEY